MPPAVAPSPTASLRERKAAATRAAIVEALAARLVARRLDEVTVEELATAAGVSRQTFFNYFATKERAVEFLFLRWLFEAQASARADGLHGADEILHLFERVGAHVAESPRRAREVLSYFASRPVDVPPQQLAQADRELVAPDLAREPNVALRDQLLRCVAEARRAGDLVAPGTDYELGHMLGVLLCACAIVGHSAPNQDWVALHRHHALRALGISPAARRAARQASSHRGPRGTQRRRARG